MTRTHALAIALLGPFGYGNLGDAAIQDAVIANLRERLPGVRLLGVSMLPEDTQARHGIETYAYDTNAHQLVKRCMTKARGSISNAVDRPDTKNVRISHSSRLAQAVRWRPARLRGLIAELSHAWYVYKKLCGIDVLLVSGGGQLDEFWGGPWRHPYTLLKWAILAKASRTRVAFLSVGVGRVEHQTSRKFLRWALGLASYRSYRDEGSLGLVHTAIGFYGRDPVVPDMAFALPLRGISRRRAREDGLLTAAIGPLPYFHPKIWPVKDPLKYGHYLHLLTDFCDQLLSRGVRIRFVVGEIHHDPIVIRDIMSLLHEKAKNRPPAAIKAIEVPQIDSVAALASQLADVDLVVSSRLHGVILSLLLYRPVLALSYERKVRQLMKDVGQESYSIELEGATVDALCHGFDDLLSKRATVELALSRQVPTFVSQVHEQFDLIATNWIVSGNPTNPTVSACV